MKTRIETVRVSLAAVVLVALTASAEKQPYERYQPIVDRQMFGPLPDGFDPTKLPSEVERTRARGTKELSKEQEQVKKSIRFSALNQMPSGEVQVGFTDNANPKTPRHYFLKVGETQDGWTVREADVENAQMTIENAEGVEVTLTLGGDSSKDGSAVSRSTGAAAARGASAGRSPLLDGASLRTRRQRREMEKAAEAARTAEAEQARQEAERARQERDAEENAKREAERQEQQKQLLQITEELRRMRELNANKPAKGAEDGAAPE